MSGASKQYILRDRDIIRDADGRIFVVLGYIQPANRALSFLKYVPASEGRWVLAGQRYRRIFYGNVDAVVDGLDIVPNDYLSDDRHFGTTLLEVPFDNIVEHYRPDDRLAEILQDGPGDRLENAAMGIAKALHEQLGIPFTDIGVSGSIAWKAHNPEFSDINMNVYGFDNSWTLQNNKDLVAQDEHVRLRRLEEWETGITRVLDRVPLLTAHDMKRLFARRFAFYYDEQCIGITPVLYPEEVPIVHGTETYTQESHDPITILFEVEKSDYSIFHPSLLVGKVRKASPEGQVVSRIMIYDGAFTGLFTEGDIIEACGTLQKVHNTTSKESDFYQLMVGTKAGSGREYIRFKE